MKLAPDLISETFPPIVFQIFQWKCPLQQPVLAERKNSEQFYSEFQISKQNICIHLNIELSKGHVYTVQTVSKSSQQQSEQACAVSRRNE